MNKSFEPNPFRGYYIEILKFCLNFSQVMPDSFIIIISNLYLCIALNDCTSFNTFLRYNWSAFKRIVLSYLEKMSNIRILLVDVSAKYYSPVSSVVVRVYPLFIFLTGLSEKVLHRGIEVVNELNIPVLEPARSLHVVAD